MRSSTPTLDATLASGRAWLAENFQADQMGHEEAWKAAVDAVLPTREAVESAALEILELADAGDKWALIAVGVAAEEGDLNAPPSIEELRSLVGAYLVNLRHDGFWDTTSALDPELWDEDEVEL